MLEKTSEKKKELLHKILIYILFFMVAFLFLTFCANNSFLYAKFTSCDQSWYITMGNGFIHGKIPYRDMYEQKGPIVYFLYAIIVFLSSNVRNAYYGAFIVKIINLAVYMYLAYKFLNKFLNKYLSIIFSIISGIIIADSIYLCWGGGAVEEYFSPVIMWFILIGYENIKGKALSKKQSLLIGLYLGLIFWSKYIILLPIIAVFVVWFIYKMIKKEYKETHPLFTKTDLAKYENTWDQLPWQVSEGAQKNFHKFMLRLKERKGFVPDELYYQNLIAKAILFRQTEKLVQKQQYGGYRANIVTYTLAFLSFKTAQRIDLERIWKEQALTPSLECEIIEISKFVQAIIVNPPGGANVGEWCKKEKCWQAIRGYEYTISDKLRSELLSVARPEAVSQQATGSIDSLSEEELALIYEASAIPAETWFALSRWAKETKNFQPWQRSLLFSVGTLAARGQKRSIKQATHAIKAYKAALEKGFTI